MGLSIKTCYTVKIQKQLDVTQDKTTEKLNITNGTWSGTKARLAIPL